MRKLKFCPLNKKSTAYIISDYKYSPKWIHSVNCNSRFSHKTQQRTAFGFYLLKLVPYNCSKKGVPILFAFNAMNGFISGSCWTSSSSWRRWIRRCCAGPHLTLKFGALTSIPATTWTGTRTVRSWPSSEQGGHKQKIRRPMHLKVSQYVLNKNTYTLQPFFGHLPDTLGFGKCQKSCFSAGVIT